MATFYNQATLTYNGNVRTSNIVTGELRPALDVVKTALTGSYTSGGVIPYIISIVNSGGAAYNGLVLTDNLGAYLNGGTTVLPLEYVEGTVRYLVNGTLQADPTVNVGTNLVISGINVPAGSNAIVFYETSVTSYAPLVCERGITNNVTVTGGNLTSPITAEATVNAECSADLRISKSLNPSVISENEELTYIFTVENFGNTAAIATDNAVIIDNFNPILNAINVTFNGDTWSSPANYTYDATTGAFSTVAGQITVPAASYVQDPTTGAWSVVPGVSTLVVRGTV